MMELSVHAYLLDYLTVTTLSANSADDELMIFFSKFSQKTGSTFHANCNLHEMSKPVF